MRISQKAIPLTIFLLTMSATGAIFGWGEEGHIMTAEVTKKYLEPAVLKEVEAILGKTSFGDAAVWMDEVRREPAYYHMVTWHYTNLEKDEEFQKNSKEENLVNILRLTVKKLNNRQKYKPKDIERHLKVVMHLMGDLHQPMHNGYGSDRGGNNVQVDFLGDQSNLHGVWDYGIINHKKISTADCLAWGAKLSPTELKEMGRLNVVEWFKEGRGYLDQAYDVKDGKIDDAYVEKNAEVVKARIFKGGYRLAVLLNRLFKKEKVKLQKGEEVE